MRFLSLLFLFVIFPFFSRAGELTQSRGLPSAATENQFDGKQLIEKLKRLKFDCTRDKGHVCRGKVEGYSEPVRIFIPPGFRSTSKKLTLHFHGNNSKKSPRDPSIHFIDGRSDFNQWMTDSGSDHILVVPESIGNAQTYEDHFNVATPKQTSANFDKFIDGIESVTGLRFSEIALSAHSGGYRAIGALGSADSSRLDQVQAIGLFDAVYGRSLQLSRWLPKLKSRGGHALFMYIDGGTTMDQGPGDQRDLNALLAKQRILPTPHRPGMSLTDISLLTVQTDHWDVLKGERYTDFLRISK